MMRKVAPRKLYNFYLDEELAAGLKAIKAQTGAPEAETVRRALADYLARKGVLQKTGLKRAATRKKP